MGSDHPSNLFLYCCCYWQCRVSAYREDQFNVNVNTNNGVERKNRAYKYQYLADNRDKTLSGVITV